MSSNPKRAASEDADDDEREHERAAKRRRLLDETVPDMPEGARQTLAELPDELWAVIAEQLTPASPTVARLSTTIYRVLQTQAMLRYRSIYDARAAVLKRLDLGRRDVAWAREFRDAGGGTAALDRLMDSALGVVLRTTLLARHPRGSGHGLNPTTLVHMAGSSFVVGTVLAEFFSRHEDMYSRGAIFPNWCIYYEVVLKLAGRVNPQDPSDVGGVEKFLRWFYASWAEDDVHDMLVWVTPRPLRGILLSEAIPRREITQGLMIARYGPVISEEALDEMHFTDPPLRQIYDFCFNPDLPGVPTGTSLESFLARLPQDGARNEATRFWLEAERQPRPFYRVPYDPRKVYWLVEAPNAFADYNAERRLRVLFDPTSVPTETARRENMESLRGDLALLEDLVYLLTDAADDPIPNELENDLTGAWTAYPDPDEGGDKNVRIERAIYMDK